GAGAWPAPRRGRLAAEAHRPPGRASLHARPRRLRLPPQSLSRRLQLRRRRTAALGARQELPAPRAARAVLPLPRGGVDAPRRSDAACAARLAGAYRAALRAGGASSGGGGDAPP